MVVAKEDHADLAQYKNPRLFPGNFLLAHLIAFSLPYNNKKTPTFLKSRKVGVRDGPINAFFSASFSLLYLFKVSIHHIFFVLGFAVITISPGLSISSSPSRLLFFRDPRIHGGERE